ncbi:hypothetical protein F511_07039 [Dorcoceras hygrometricum]|uniref:Uncharacterized protein n=1 Tax=Dorcoceras hygrometricum TaxID=472368 RepID=A0A2Z7D696_9LAMI|nr:hypothetical protein F511_07039 [Dorcoceras hygrometricum]
MPPINHLETRGPSSTLQAKPGTPARETPEDLRFFPRTVSRRNKIAEDHGRSSRRSWRISRLARDSAEICSSQPPSPSINTRHPGEALSTFQCPATDVVPDARAPSTAEVVLAFRLTKFGYIKNQTRQTGLKKINGLSIKISINGKIKAK